MYLNCHSFHSLRYGTIPVDELVQLGKLNGAFALALTDIHTSAGVVDFVKKCRENGIKPLVGIEFRKQNSLLYVAIAKSKEGFAEICTYLSGCNMRQLELSDFAPEFKEVFVIYPFDNLPKKLKNFEYIGVRADELTKLIMPHWKRWIPKMTILQTVTFRTKEEYNLHKILRAIDLNVIGSKLSSTDHCRHTDKMISQNELIQAYCNFPEIIQNTENIIHSCNFDLDFSVPKNKRFYTGTKEKDKTLLTQLAFEGLIKRYGKDCRAAADRVKRELEIIDKLEFSSYFLITWDIIQFSNSKGFMHIGRGSGANSIVSYCLGITDICPIELDLYFERFLNPSRTSPPDFDIDWAWTDRDTILTYIFERFGKDHVAFTGTTVEFKYRSIFRELGKVFGLPKDEIDSLAKLPIDQHDQNHVVKQIHFYGKMLTKYPNQRSMHSCGILISEEPITNYMVLEMPPKGFPTAQINMHDAEAMGFEKFDILSQRGIGHINDAVRLIKQNRNEIVNIRDVSLSKDEKQANQFLKIGKTIGCFYIESPAMRGLLRRLQCDSYKVLVAASSVIRPGVAKSGMMAEYVFRHRYPDRFEYFHPIFREHLGETYGVMVYQEDVIKIAHHFAGIDLAQADILRRAMSGKTRSIKELDKLKETYFKNCKKKGYSEKLALEVYRQIESFAGYSFCKAHSASYAIESYQSLYLKVYYPIEFMVAVIINEGGFYRTEVYIHEARMAGAVICNPCVNKGEYLTTVRGKEVYLGFRHLQNLEERIAKLIPEEREINGDFTSLENFINRIPIGIEGVQVLIFIGAFRFTGKTKNELILQARMLLTNYKPENRNAFLIQEPIKEYALPVLERSPFEDAFDEIELVGFPVSCSPFDLLKTKYRGHTQTRELIDLHKKQVRMVGYLISIKDVPIQRGLMRFGTWIDHEGNYFDTTHWPESLKDYPFQGNGGCYLLLGIVEVQFDFPSILITKMARLPFIPDPRYADDIDMRYKAHDQIRTDISTTHRDPYPRPQEIGLPRYKMAD